MSQPNRKLSRRTVFLGVGTVGAVATTAALLPHAIPQQPQGVPAAQPAPEKGGGYQLTDHVKRYYKTTLI